MITTSGFYVVAVMVIAVCFFGAIYLTDWRQKRRMEHSLARHRRRGSA